jgi:hypothetical protein
VHGTAILCNLTVTKWRVIHVKNSRLTLNKQRLQYRMAEKKMPKLSNEMWASRTQVGAPPEPTFRKGSESSFAGYGTAMPKLYEQDLAKTLLSSLSPFRPLPSTSEDAASLSKAVDGVMEAIREDVITQEEGAAIISLMVRSFAGRRVSSAFAHLTSSMNFGALVFVEGR